MNLLLNIKIIIMDQTPSAKLEIKYFYCTVCLSNTKNTACHVLENPQVLSILKTFSLTGWKT